MTSDAPASQPRLTLDGIRTTGGRISVTPHGCFACGTLNTHGLQLQLHAVGDRCWTRVTLPRRFEGWEGIAHGGIVATILDEVMAWALVERDLWGVTARMSIEYKRPVRVEEPIRAEGWVVAPRRRLVTAAARIVGERDGELLAAGEALYVGASDERKAELKARYSFAIVPDERAP